MDNLDIDLESSLKYSERRPIFLTVLCILTFIGSGYVLLSSFWNLANFGSLQKSMRIFSKTKDFANPFTNETVDHAISVIDQISAWLYWSYILGTIGALLAIIGAILMMKRQRAGFIIYVIAQILPILPGIGVLSYVDQIPILGFFFKLAYIFGLLFTVGFIIMYATQLKNMWWKKPDYIS